MTCTHNDEWFLEKEIPTVPLWLKIVLWFCPTKISKDGNCTTMYKTFMGRKIITGLIWHFGPFIIPWEALKCDK